MNGMGKGVCKKPKSFRISDILGDELCERKRRRDNDQENRDCYVKTRCLEDDPHYMVLKTKHTTRNEEISERRSPAQTELVHQHIPRWIPLFSSSLKYDKEERIFAGRSRRIFVKFYKYLHFGRC